MLVVDDDPLVRRLIEAFVATLGRVAVSAPDGAAGVALFRRHAAAVECVLLDVRMPGLDGPATLAALRAIDPGVRSCFVTADPAPWTEAELLALGAAAVLPKPFPLAALAGVLSGGRPAAPSSRPGGRQEVAD